MSLGEHAQNIIATATLEELVTHPAFFGLTTASNAQRAICRIVDGVPLGTLAADPDVRTMVGDVDALPTEPPFETALLSGVRVFKSLLAAALSVRWSQRCEIPSYVGPGEVPRIPLISLDKERASVVLAHLVGRVQQSPLLRLIVVRELAEGLRLRHPSGRPIEVKVSAGKKSGAAVVSVWLAGLVFDEFPRMNGEADGVVNWDETRKAAENRVLKGGGIFDIGSPYAPLGPAYDMATEHHGKPTRKLVVLMAPAWVINPVYWTPERVEEARKDPDSFVTDVEGKFSTPEESLVPVVHVDQAVRARPAALPRAPGATYIATMDPATRGNGWTLVIATKVGQKILIARAREWVGSRSAPLNPVAVLDEVKVELQAYGLDSADTDQHMSDMLTLTAATIGVRLHTWTINEEDQTKRYLQLRTLFAMGCIEIPDEVNLRRDLVSLKRRITKHGITIVLPKTSDGRHCDFAPVLMLVMNRYIEDVGPPPPPPLDEETRMMREAVERRWGPRRDDDE